MRYDAIMIKEQDNVATALKDLLKNQKVNIVVGNKHFSIVLVENISYGHKFAVKDIEKGEVIIKYGEVMGKATSKILKGSHAHIHNIESLRGRGDLACKGA